MQSSFQHTIRATAFIIGAVFAGAALAAEKNNSSSDEAAAKCANDAAIRFSIETAQCGVYPGYSEMYGNCMANAASKYAITAAMCGTGNASATLATSDGGDDSGGGKTGKFGRGQFGNPVGGLSISGGGDNNGAGKPAKFSVGKLGGFKTFGG